MNKLLTKDIYQLLFPILYFNALMKLELVFFIYSQRSVHEVYGQSKTTMKWFNIWIINIKNQSKLTSIPSIFVIYKCRNQLQEIIILLAMNEAEVELIYSYLIIRSYQLLEQCPNESKNKYKIVVNELIYGKLWIIMLGATRGFEAYDYDQDQKLYFKHGPQNDILKSTGIIKRFIKDPPQLKPYRNPYMLGVVKNILKQNKNIISIICQAEIIDDYFNQTIFMQFTHDSDDLAGLSAYHGGITYIKKNMNLLQTLTTIIHEFAHNISRFLMKKKKVCYISPKKNKELGYFCRKDKQFKQQEAGNFIESKLFGIDDKGSGPFGLKKFQIY